MGTRGKIRVTEPRKADACADKDAVLRKADTHAEKDAVLRKADACADKDAVRKDAVSVR